MRPFSRAAEGSLQSIHGLNRDTVLKKAAQEISDETKRLDFEASIIGMNGQARAAAELDNRFKDLLATFPQLTAEFEKLKSSQANLSQKQMLGNLDEQMPYDVLCPPPAPSER